MESRSLKNWLLSVAADAYLVFGEEEKARFSKAELVFNSSKISRKTTCVPEVDME